MKTILWNLAVAAVATALTLASCQRPIDVEGKTIFGRQSIDLMAEGERYEKAGNYAMALDRYGKALELSPRPALYYRVGRCYYQRSEFTKAHEYLSAAVRLAGDYPEAQYLLSKVRIQLALAARQGGKPPATTATAAPVVTPAPPVVVMPPPARTPAATAVAMAPTPPPTPSREVVEKPIEPTRTPVVMERTRVPPTPTPRPTPTPEPILPMPTPRPTPTAAESTPSPPISPPVISTPPPSVERIATPRPSPRSGVAATPPVGTIPPVLKTEDIFPPQTATDVTTSRTARSTVETTGTVTANPLLGQWQFHWEQAQSFIERKMDQEAVDELLLVLGSQPHHLDARLQLAEAYDRLGRGEKALEQYERARVFSANHPKALFRTGNYYLRHAEDSPQNAGYYDRARYYYYLAVNQDPKYYFAFHNIGVSYMKQGNYETARKWFEKALEVMPDYASAHRNLGLLYEQHLKNPEAALYHYRRYLDLGGPDADEVREWIRALEEAP